MARFGYRNADFISVTLALSACEPITAQDVIAQQSAAPDLSTATKVDLWATRYYLYEADPSDAPGAVPLRDMDNAVIGPALSPRDWCLAAIEGSTHVAGTTYNYAGVRNPRQASCAAHRPSERVRWRVSPFSFGVGSANNPLIPFRTLACDLGTVANSEPWLDGGFAIFGQEIFIPSAVGTVLPDGTVHDGIFTCADTGGLITGNHVDVFVGGANGEADAASSDPFSFIGSASSRRFEAYVLP